MRGKKEDMLPGEASSVPLWRALRARVTSAGSPTAGADVILRHFRAIAPPVAVEQFASSMGVPLERVSKVRWSGAVNSTTFAAKIWVRGSDAPVRQRFTIAHELGHLMLHEIGVAYRDDTFSGGWKEAQANQFAAALLVPQWMLRDYYRRQSSKVLASLFEVSEQAMMIQISKLIGVPAEDVK
ncbi:ImmA/IrrE family metallo-endopeptidase [Sorangium sp. So ce136]|uniref:ImmA/IrrE family metallo-endopeptidase n=1 Tax=Sorangium sp. So ce136 TaxID=3133284 RepID=UPI003F100A9A